MKLRLPTRFVMLDKAIATLGAVGIELYPDFNVFEIAKPYARDLMISRFTPRRIASRARREGWQLTQMAADLPYQIHETLEQVRDGQIEVGFVHKGLDEFMAKLDVALQPARDRARRHRRADRLEPDRHLREERAAHPRPARRLGARLHALGRARRLAALERHPLRAALTTFALAVASRRPACSRRA